MILDVKQSAEKPLIVKNIQLLDVQMKMCLNKKIFKQVK